MADRSATLERARERLGARLGDLSGAVADLGVLVPLAAALIVVNGLNASGVFVGAGLLVLLAGALFRIPFPVQPLKALTAVAVAERLAPGVIHAAGLEIAAFLFLLSIGGVADKIARIFTKPVVRSLQLGVGILLALSAYKLVRRPPAMFVHTPSSPWPIVLAIVSFAAVWWAAHTKRYALALALLCVGVLAVLHGGVPHMTAPALALPQVALPHARDFTAAFLLLVVPQLPLTFGNAVVAVNDVAHDYFDQRARRVTPSRICLSCGAGNVVSALIGGMPMCHGAGGLTAHVRLGARTAWMNVVLGVALFALGLVFAAQVTVILGLLPVWVLAAFLAFAGARHAQLVSDLRGASLVAAVVAGGVGAAFGNLAITVVIALSAEHLLLARLRPLSS